MWFNGSEVTEWALHYQNIWNEAKSWLFEKLTTKPTKEEGKYMHGELKTWKEHIKTNFQGQDVSIWHVLQHNCSAKGWLYT